jgi:phosphomannomutase
MKAGTKIFFEGKTYGDKGGVYYKPLAKFLKFGTSGVRWLVSGAAGILEKMPARLDYYISNGYRRTVGGRAVLAEDFNMPNAGIVIKSIARYILSKAHGEKLLEKGLLVMYDNRPGNFEYAEEAAKILAYYGIKAVLNKSDGEYAPAPLPAASRLVQEGGYAGSIIFTASHNGDEWNGIKFEGADGGAAGPEITNAIGVILAQEFALADPARPVSYDVREESLEGLIRQGKVGTIDALDLYAEAVFMYLNIEAIKKAIKDRRVEFIYSAFFGSSGPAMVKLFRKLGLPTDDIIETHKAADQAYVASYEPALGKLKKLTQLVEERGMENKEKGLNTVVVGGAADNDADRFQVNQYNRATGKAEEFAPEKLSAVLGHYLCKYKGFKGPFGRSFVTGSLQDEVAKLFGQETIETPTGFKFSPMVFVENQGVLFTEESYGISFKGWTLDKDGILPSLLALELVAVTGKSLDEYYRDLLDELSSRGLDSAKFFRRYDQALDENTKQEAIRRFTGFFNGIKAGDTCFGGRKVTKRYDPKEYDGGMKLVLADGSWIAFRSSGTEPIIRIYVEARSEEDRELLKKKVFELIGI